MNEDNLKFQRAWKQRGTAWGRRWRRLKLRLRYNLPVDNHFVIQILTWRCWTRSRVRSKQRTSMLGSLSLPWKRWGQLFFSRRFGFCLFLFGGRGEVWKSWRQLFVVTDFCLSFEERGGVNYVDFLSSLELFISCHSASIICKLILADFWPVKANWPFVNSQISLWRH